MEIQDEYVELAGQQPSRGHTPLGAILLFVAVLVSGTFVVFGKGLLMTHFLSQESEESKRTVVVDYDGTESSDPSFEFGSAIDRPSRLYETLDLEK